VVLTPDELINSASNSKPTIIRKENKVGERIFLSILAPVVCIAKLQMVLDQTVAEHHKIRSVRIKRGLTPYGFFRSFVFQRVDLPSIFSEFPQ